jgi:hypothetical protein
MRGSRIAMAKWKKVVFIASIVLNLWFIFNWMDQPAHRYGVLISDVTVPLTKDATIMLPKGLVVRDESLQGISSIGQFDEYRFSITITSGFKMVDYNVDWKAINSPGSLYHAPDDQFMPLEK